MKTLLNMLNMDIPSCFLKLWIVLVVRIDQIHSLLLSKAYFILSWSQILAMLEYANNSQCSQ